jgi:hypothetical protein
MLTISSLCAQNSAQKNNWGGLSIYAPQYTKHFIENPSYNVNGILNSEGGNSGLVATYSANKLMHYSVGFIKNSYGDWSKFVTVGITVLQTKKSQLSFHIGLADNYGEPYSVDKNRKTLEKFLPRIITSNNIMPAALLTYKVEIIKINTTKVGIQINATPMYINAGIFVKL